MEKIYAYDQDNGTYVYRIPGHMHGDGQIDTDDEPVWLECSEKEALQAMGDAEIPTVRGGHGY